MHAAHRVLSLQGIVRGLLEQGLLPRIIAGSSVGSIVAALAAVHTDEELRTMYSNMNTFNLSFFANNTTLAAAFHLLTKGSLQGVYSLLCCIWKGVALLW